MKNSMIDENSIEELLAKFMDGLTTIEEEDILSAYFRSGKVRREWDDYREMFAYFDSGMAANVPRISFLPRLWKIVATVAAVAAAVVWIVSIRPPRTSQPTETQEYMPLVADETQQNVTEEEVTALLPQACTEKRRVEQPLYAKATQRSEDVVEQYADIPVVENASIAMQMAIAAIDEAPAEDDAVELSSDYIFTERDMTDDEKLDLQLLLLDSQMETLEAVGQTLLDDNERLVDCLYLSNEAIY